MKILLDTHTFIWWAGGMAMLPVGCRQHLGNPSNLLYLSSASIFEIANKVRLGKLPFHDDLLGIMSEGGFVELPIRASHARLAGSLPGPHRDPFDRLIAAQALVESLVVMGNDTALDDFGVTRLWN